MRRKKIFSVSSKKYGFTLVEVIVVLAILAIITAITIPVLTGYIDKAKETTLISNMSYINKMVYLYSTEYEKSDWYGSYSEDDKTSLNNFLELEWEAINNGTYENNITLKNPYSDKMSILDYNKTLSSGDGYCPAVFLTANNSYAYDTGTGSTKNIIGTIVIYFKVTGNTTEYITIYYVDKDGAKSSTSYVLD